MKIYLLTHKEEKKKASGTGKLVKEVLGNECEVIEWSRVSPDKAISSLPIDKTILVYLCNKDDNSPFEHNTSPIENIIIIDGTWQQARKIYNQSPYLKPFFHYEIQGEKSIYTKRRNQKQTGLCTAEVALHFLKMDHHPKALALLNLFTEFNQ